MERISVIGAGSWGTTVASLCASRNPTMLWARRPELAKSINESQENLDYLPGRPLPHALEATSSLENAVSGASIVVMAVPSHGFRSVFSDVVPFLGHEAAIISLTKGVEQKTSATMTEVIRETADDRNHGTVGVLTGPNLASEIMAGQPTAAVIAMADPVRAQTVQTALMGPAFRVYTNDDIVGCELSGAMKNVMAIAAGMSDGLGFGDNTRATLLTRALAELTRLGVSRGGRPETFAGLAGMGDLIATCSSPLSRNRQVGVALAEGKTTDQIVDEMNMVAEGVQTTRGVLGLATQSDVEMPIAAHIGEVLYNEMPPREAVISLMTREARAEY